MYELLFFVYLKRQRSFFISFKSNKMCLKFKKICQQSYVNDNAETEYLVFALKRNVIDVSKRQIQAGAEFVPGNPIREGLFTP